MGRLDSDTWRGLTLLDRDSPRRVSTLSDGLTTAACYTAAERQVGEGGKGRRCSDAPTTGAVECGGVASAKGGRRWQGKGAKRTESEERRSEGDHRQRGQERQASWVRGSILRRGGRMGKALEPAADRDARGSSNPGSPPAASHRPRFVPPGWTGASPSHRILACSRGS